jgi:Pvc16 N-terminal domain
MSNPRAIEAVTSTLRFLLEQTLKPHVPDVSVTTYPPDRAFDKSNLSNRVNLFLYHTTVNAAWRNQDLTPQVRPGETAQPPLAINLHYLLTAYSKDQDFPTPLSHQLLGRSMSFLHDHSILLGKDIKNALAANLADHDLYDQIEKVKITPHNLSLEELSKLWMIFQTAYRVSAAYEASVVLIESRRPTSAPLPVLQRGIGDRGPTVQPDLLSPYPVLTEVLPPNRQPAVRLGDQLILNGSRLDAGTPRFQFTHPRLKSNEAVPIQLVNQSPTRLTVKLMDVVDDPTAADRWVAGLYSLTVIFRPIGATDAVRDRATNVMPIAVAPRLTGLTATTAMVAGRRVVTIRVTCRPKVRSGQRASLVLTDRGDGGVPLPISNLELIAKAQAPQAEGGPIIQTDTLEFVAGDVPAGTYFVRPRLRIDGVDSLLVQDYGATPMVFIPFQSLTIPA